jgi:hypothetical protein
MSERRSTGRKRHCLNASWKTGRGGERLKPNSMTENNAGQSTSGRPTRHSIAICTGLRSPAAIADSVDCSSKANTVSPVKTRRVAMRAFRMGCRHSLAISRSRASTSQLFSGIPCVCCDTTSFNESVVLRNPMRVL